MKRNQSICTIPRLIGGGSALSIAIFTRLTVGSPLALIHQLPSHTLPPIWLFSLLWMASFALLGATAGHLLTCVGGSHQREACLWRGGTFMVLAMMFSLDWYTLLFGKFLFFPACLCLILSALAALICALSWIRVQKGAAVSPAIFFLWQTCLLICQIMVFLRT